MKRSVKRATEQPPPLKHNIFQEISGSDKTPETTVEAWNILTARNKKIAVQAKSYGFEHKRYSDDLDAEIDDALK